MELLILAIIKAAGNIFERVYAAEALESEDELPRGQSPCFWRADLKEERMVVQESAHGTGSDPFECELQNGRSRLALKRRRRRRRRRWFEDEVRQAQRLRVMLCVETMRTELVKLDGVESDYVLINHINGEWAGLSWAGFSWAGLGERGRGGRPSSAHARLLLITLLSFFGLFFCFFIFFPINIVENYFYYHIIDIVVVIVINHQSSVIITTVIVIAIIIIVFFPCLFLLLIRRSEKRVGLPVSFFLFFFPPPFGPRNESECVRDGLKGSRERARVT